MQTPTATTRELQRRLIQAKRLDIGGGYDLWDRYGAQHETPEERARKEAEAAEIMRQGAAATDALLALIAASDTDDVRAWAHAHELYLQELLTTYAADSVEAEIATNAIEQWGKVRAGELPYANVYQLVEPDRYRRYFGIDPETLEDVSSAPTPRP